MLYHVTLNFKPLYYYYRLRFHISSGSEQVSLSSRTLVPNWHPQSLGIGVRECLDMFLRVCKFSIEMDLI